MLDVIGGLPAAKTPLNARITGTIPMDGYRIEKVLFESLPGLHVTALVYVPDAPSGPKPAVLVACGHAPDGKSFRNYQELSGQLARRGYVVICWDPVGQGERSQFWDAARGRSRYNLVCGEHAVLGNLACVAGSSLVRYMVWDGMRALDYLLTRAGRRPRPHRGDGHERRRVPVPVPGRARRAHRGGGARPASSPRCPCAWRTGSSRTRTAIPSRIPIVSSPRASTTRAAAAASIRARSSCWRRSRTSFPSRARARRSARWPPSTAPSATATASPWPKASTATCTRRRTAAPPSRSSTASSGLPARTTLDPIKILDPAALRCTPTGQVRVDLPGRSLPEVIREELARAPAAPKRRSRTSIAATATRGSRLARRPKGPAPAAGVIAWEAAGGVDVGDVRDRPLPAAPRRAPGDPAPAHPSRSAGPAGARSSQLSLEGKVGAADWPDVRRRLDAGRRGALVRPARGGREPDALPRGLGRRSDPGRGRRGAGLLQSALGRAGQPRLQRAPDRPPLFPGDDRGRRDRVAVRAREAGRPRAGPGAVRSPRAAWPSRPRGPSRARGRGRWRTPRPSAGRTWWSRCARSGRSSTSCPEGPRSIAELDGERLE